MYTLSHKYTNKKLLKEWLIKHQMDSKEECLVQLFCGVPKKSTIKSISLLLKKVLPLAHIIASTTDGEMYNDTVTTKEIIISLSVFEKSSVFSAAVEYETDSYSMGHTLAEKLDGDDVKAMILFTTGLAINGEAFLKGVTDISNGKYIISGGMAGDNGDFRQTYLVHDSSVISKGAVGVVLKGDELHVNSQYQFGWSAVGLPMRVTKSKRNRVYEIDNTPVIDVYEKYFGKKVAKSLPKIGAEIPLIADRDGVSIARSCVNRYDDGSLLFAGNVNENEEVRFGIGSIDLILKDSAYFYEKIARKFIPESVFVYSCVARRHLLNDQSSIELYRFKDKCSISGFFTYGEFFSDEKHTYLFNETMTILALSESDKASNKKADKNEVIEQAEEHNSTMMQALTHMTNVIAKEWQDRVNEEIEKNKKQEEENFQKNKLVQMGEMVGMIAHQWRQPLNAISATGINISLLSSMNMLDEKKVQESSEFIQEQCQKMSATIDTFMNFVKPAKESKPFKLSHTVEAIMQIMGTQLSNHNIEVSVEIKDDNISIVGHEDLLEQVIINILSNARDAFSTIEKADKYINITVDMQDTIPLIRIEDNAGGVPDDVKNKIFNPYFTTKEQGKGTGIGLYMSMNIMKKSFHGDIAYKEIEGGSCFEVICGGREIN